MTTPPPPAFTPDQTPMSRRIRPRLLLLLVGLTAVICASVIVADALSPRDRGRPVVPSPSDISTSPRVP